MNKVIYENTKVPIKLWLDDIEEGALQQAKNAANLPFIYKHIAIMPDAHQGYGVSIGSVLATEGVVIPNAIGVDIGCFTGNTKIALPCENDKTLKELYDNKQKNFPVYSINKEGKYCIGLADEVKLTRINAKLIELTLDNNEIIKCTPDHQFMLRNGSYKEAKDLTAEDSLMPLYRKLDRDGYEFLGIRSNGARIKTHWIIAKSGLLGAIPKFKNDTIIHHKDKNPKNNALNNLEFMDLREHLSMHGKERSFFKTEEFKILKNKTIKDRGYFYDPIYYQKKADIGRKNITDYMNNNPTHFATVVKENAKRGSILFSHRNSDKEMIKSQWISRIKKVVDKCLKISNKITPSLYEKYRKLFNNYPCYNKAISISNSYGFKNLEEVSSWKPINHKIIKKICLNYKENVYCLTVEKYHNFALSSGVFVHNCGIIACKTSLKADQLDKETLKLIIGKIREFIPVGFEHHKEKQDMSLMPNYSHLTSINSIVIKEYNNALKQLGTLGGGNHFIELQKDIAPCVCLNYAGMLNYTQKGKPISDCQECNGTGKSKDYGNIWIMIHSGSRNLGYKVANHYNKIAIELNKKWFSNVPKEWELAFLPIDTKEAKDYMSEMQYCVDFALANRKLMMERIFDCIRTFFPNLNDKYIFGDRIINIAHNYAQYENHYSKNVIVHRKGATLARLKTIGIIPGSMGSKSYIVEGLGNKESFESCSHGAGRALGRKEAIRTLNLEIEKQKLDSQGIIHGIRNQDDLEEATNAYKDISIVMKNQEDLVKILVELQPLASIKG